MKYKHLINQMTLSEKCRLLSGKDIWSTKPIERLGIEAIHLSDGPSGLRKQVGEGDHLGLNASLPSTCWPAAASVACSWDPKLGEQIGQILGEEAIVQDVDVVLGPGLNIKRSALCGRNFEYFSEDPYLSGKLAAGYIRGIQTNGLAACPKHFAANNQELLRMTSNSVIDERTLREIYLTNFEIAVKEGKPKSIMSSYNKLNGVYTNENEYLLQDILRSEWGFDGAVVTDWGGSNDHVQGVKAGSHLEMPGTGGDSDWQLENAVKDGSISELLVNQRVDEFLDFVYSIKPISKPKAKKFDIDLHHNIAGKVAEQTVVLLKNNENILPIKPGTRVAVIGDFAANPRYQGAGSSMVNPTKVESALDVIGNYNLEVVGFAPGYRRNGYADRKLAKHAVELAKQAEVVFLYIGLHASSEIEGVDRINMQLPQNQEKLIKEIAKTNHNIVILLAAGGSVEMPWIDDCEALIYGCLGGQAGAAALLNAVTGKVNPCGKLAETFPLRYEDTPASNYYPGRQRSSEYREGLYVGYRYFETVNIPVLFPFGFGLSYTTFEYSNLSLSKKKVSFMLKNTGDVAGAEIVQVYIGCTQSNIFRPAKELKAFDKVFLKPNESKNVNILLDDKAFRYFNVKTHKWEIETAQYNIMVGASVQDLRLSDKIFVEGTEAPCPYDSNSVSSYYTGYIENVPNVEFESVLGHSIPECNWNTGGMLEINDALCQMYYAKSRFARLIYRIIRYLKNKSIAKGKVDMNIFFIYNIPFRGIAKLTNGIVTMEMAKSMVVIVNGHFFEGLKQLCSSVISARKRKRK